MKDKLKILLVDFDGTVAEDDFPRIGPPLPNVFEVLNELRTAGWKLILWTCREDDSPEMYLTQAVDYCKGYGFIFDAINHGIHEDWYTRPIGSGRKPHATVHVDDKNLGGFPGWDAVRKALLNG